MLPRWLKKSVPSIEQTKAVRQVLAELDLNTVCRSAHCPNLGECFAAGTATFLILGNSCTRTCSFCAIDKGNPLPLDTDEPQRIAQAVAQLGINHVVITSVTRDDLADGGAEQYVATIQAIRQNNPKVTIEILVPDFLGSESAVTKVLTAAPEIFNHNLETVERLYPTVRPQADYHRSLKLLAFAKEFMPELIIKSGIMIGLGETKNEIFSLMDDLISVKCNILTIGQYLRPSAPHHPVKQYYTPAEFDELRNRGLEKGFAMV
ncbi:MAG: lipoyl synthase, partial [bacterium]|nr:lipoyl synthase [bacterium]